jgi:DNA-binding protein HU-beta
MNKAQLINEVAAAGGLKKKDAAAAVDATINSIIKSIKEGTKVQLSGFGTFETKTRGARTGRNPKTGETVMIPESRYPVFTASKALKKSFK